MTRPDISTLVDKNGDSMSRIIVAISGGKTSAWCANWAINKYGHENVTLYFNDTKWEHPDLYRFLDDVSAYLEHDIHEDTDGRSPEQLFYDNHALANNRMPFCSHQLKAKRLQRFVEDGDTIVFGIAADEQHRANRIRKIYDGSKVKSLTTLFPIIEERPNIDSWLASTGIREPEMYLMGFSHNNCSGGCVRAGKKQWIKLLKKMPEVYAERERVEREFNQHFGSNHTFLKDESLEELRIRAERNQIKWDSIYQEELPLECFGCCIFQN